MNHLNPEAQKMVSLDNEARIRHVQRSVWLSYPRAQTVLHQMENLMRWPKTSRMPNLLIIGDTNNGKTWVLERFQSLHSKADADGTEDPLVPVVKMEPPSEPNESRFYDHLLSALFTPFSVSDRVNKKREQAIDLLQYANTRIILVDELHKMLAGSPARQRQMLNVLREIGNILRIPIVAAGTSEALRFVTSDPQLSNRFRPLVLPRWSMDDQFRTLLASFESIIPLAEPSGLSRLSMARTLHSMSEGLLGEVHTILADATLRTLEDGKESITGKTLEELNWIRPAERRFAAKELA